MGAGLELECRRLVYHVLYLQAAVAETQSKFDAYSALFKRDFSDMEQQPVLGSTSNDHPTDTRPDAPPPAPAPYPATTTDDKADQDEPEDAQLEPSDHEECSAAALIVVHSIYKRLALRLHPDKRPHGCSQAFQELEHACRRRDLATMALLAERSGLKLLLDWLPTVCEALSAAAQRLEAQQAHFRSTVAWVWGTADDSQRDSIREEIWRGLDSQRQKML
jgi:hypothetical protein